MAFNVVYADKDKIKSSIEQGIIPTESLILTNGNNQSEAFYYDDNGKLKQVTKKSSFNSMTEALSWINKNDYSGEIISIFENGKWNSYIVNGKQLSRLLNENDLLSLEGGKAPEGSK